MMTEYKKNIKTNVIHKLVNNFFNGNLKFVLTPAEINELSLKNQEEFLQSTIYSSIFKNYPLRVEFCRLFFKKLIQHLETYQEIHDDIYKFVCALMKNKLEENEFCYRHYTFDSDLNNIITIKETNNMVVNGTTGMKTWEAAIMFSDWILCNKELFHNKRVLELGSGLGFTGITIGKFCAPKAITMTDCHIDVLKLLVENIEMNFSDLQRKVASQHTYFRDEEKDIDVMKLDWNCIKNIDEIPKPDIVIGADIIYDPSILLPLCNVLQTFFNINPHLQVYIASVIRNEDTFNKFLKLLGNINVVVDKQIPTKCTFLNWDQEMHRCLLKIKRNLK